MVLLSFLLLSVKQHKIYAQDSSTHFWGKLTHIWQTYEWLQTMIHFWWHSEELYLELRSKQADSVDLSVQSRDIWPTTSANMGAIPATPQHPSSWMCGSSASMTSLTNHLHRTWNDSLQLGKVEYGLNMVDPLPYDALCLMEIPILVSLRLWLASDILYSATNHTFMSIYVLQ